MTSTRLAFHELRRRFGRLEVLAGLSGEAEPGGILLVTGANGSGKSTLLRCLAGLLAPDSGEVEMLEDGRSLSPGERRQRVGYVAPDLAFYEELTVAENLELAARLRGLPAAEAERRRDQVGLPGGRAVAALSSGMLQRLRWAWARLHRPAVLLLDEPFQNLDAPGQEQARGFLRAHLDGEEGAPGLAVVADPRLPELADLEARVSLRLTL